MLKLEIGSVWVNLEYSSQHIAVHEINDDGWVAYCDNRGDWGSIPVQDFLNHYESRLDWIKRTRHGRSIGVELRGNRLDCVG